VTSIFKGRLFTYKLVIGSGGCLAGLVVRRVDDESLDVEAGRDGVVECCRGYGTVCEIVERVIEETGIEQF
jgi:hypothetical protein